MPAIDRRHPVRTCIGCRQRRPQPELVRITRPPDDGGTVTPGRGPVVVDGPSSGRGAWLCRDTIHSCADVAIARRQFDRAWRTSLDDADITTIRAAVRDVRATHDDDDEEVTR